MTHTGLSRSLAALNEEWRHVQDACPQVAGQVREESWGAIVARVRADPDSTLGCLLAWHRDGVPGAGRAVIQAMLPKMVLMAVRDPEASLDDYMAALWIRVATYPLERRPERIAANLALDTLKSVKTPRPRPVSWSPSPPPEPWDDAAAVLDAGVRMGVIDPVTRRTLEVVYVAGHTSKQASELLGVSADAVRWRCSKGVRALRAVAEDLLDAVAA